MATSKAQARSKAEQAESEVHRSGPLGKLLVYLKTLGPGLITGASDDDPSGIGTYAQTGALFGYAQLWLMLYSIPCMIAFQEMCARIALQTGSSLMDNLRKHYPRPLLYCGITLLLIANTINIGADLGAMAAAGQLIVGLPFFVWLIAITLLSTLLEIFVDYKQYVKVLRFLTLSLFTYVLVIFFNSPDWTGAGRHVHPALQSGQRLHHQHRRGAGHDDFAVPVLLANTSGSRRTDRRGQDDAGKAPRHEQS